MSQWRRAPSPAAELRTFLRACPPPVRALVQGLRRVMRRWAPGAVEAVRFHALCYFTPGQPFGAIGGNLCMIEAGRHGVRLSFLHGASLPDPGKLLQGAGKAKRFLPIRGQDDVRRSELVALVCAAARRSAGRLAR